MPNSHRSFSLKNDPELTRIYQAIKFPQAKRNLLEYQTPTKLPGPSLYKYENYQKNTKSPQFSFGKEKKGLFRSKKKLHIPQITPYENQKAKTQTKYQEPKTSRNDTESTKDIIGVQSHNFERESAKMQKLMKFTQQSQKQKAADINATPGPFDYSPEKIKNYTQYGTFYRAKRNSFKLQQIPGVGRYSIDKYENRHSPNARFPSQNGRQKKYRSIEAPGPASYTACLVQKYKAQSRSTSISFCKAQRPEKFLNGLKSGPGPGDYDIEGKIGIASPSSFRATRYSQQSQKWLKPFFHPQPSLDVVPQKQRSAREHEINKRFRKKSKGKGAGTSKFPSQKLKSQMNSTGFGLPFQVNHHLNTIQ